MNQQAQDSWKRLLPASYPQGLSEHFVKQRVEAAVHEAGHAVVAVIRQVPFVSVSVSRDMSEWVPVPGQPGRMTAAGGGIEITGPIGGSKFLDMATMLASGSAATRLILGWVSPHADAQDRADFVEALTTLKAATPELRDIPDAAAYDAFAGETYTLMRDTPGAASAIEHIAQALLVKQRLEATEVADVVAVFVPASSS